MTDETLELTETIKARDYPRPLQNASLSTRAKFEIFTGTYQQVIDALDVNGVPEHKVKGFAFVSAGNCEVIVHKQ